jgi:NADH:ubiquinone reductase (non-electrogenic)
MVIRSRMASPSIMQLSSLSRRSLSTRSPALALRLARPLRFGNSSQQSLQRTFRRSYADAAPAPKPKKRFRFLRWAWRLTWLSGVGLTGALLYSIYESRHPIEQLPPDPTKKTLVILGMLGSLPCLPPMGRVTNVT